MKLPTVEQAVAWIFMGFYLFWGWTLASFAWGIIQAQLAK